MSEETTTKKNRSYWIVLVFVFVAGVLTALIGTKTFSPSENNRQLPSSTPYESFTNFIKSFEFDTGSLAFDYCSATKTEREIINTFLAMERAAKDFRRDLIEAYGDDAWDILNDPDNGPSDGNINMPLIGDTIIDKDKIVRKGDSASYIVNDNVTLISVRTSDGWLIDASCLIPEGAKAEDFLEFSQRVPFLIKKYQKVIGHPGIGVVDIDAELGRELLSPIFSFDTPHRFDIDAIIAEIDSNGVESGDTKVASDETAVQDTGKNKTVSGDDSIEIENIQVGGIRLVKYDNEENGVRSFNWSKGYTLSIIAELSDEILDVESGHLNKAITDTGVSIHKDPRISFPKLSDDNKVLCFEVKLLVPDGNVSGFKEISGELDCSTSAGEKTVDLGIEEFKAGTSGDMFNAKILSIKKAAEEWRENEFDLQMRMDHNESFGGATFFDDKGNKLAVETRGWSSDGETLTINFSKEGGFPEKGRVEVLVYQGVKQLKLPFELVNISLLGNPL